MAQGRCAGCGLTGSSCKKMKSHILSCQKYVEVWKQDPARALEPEEEFERWQREEGSPEAKALAKEERLTKRFAEMDAKRTMQTGRFATPEDPLA